MQNQQAHHACQHDIVVAFDTANEYIAVGVGRLLSDTKEIQLLASQEVPAFRASNTKLISCIDHTLNQAGVSRDEIACVVCGRGPGSFTGVRICLATAKGLALGMGAPLFGVSTLDAQAYVLWHDGIRGSVVLLGDAMRKEVYPVRYLLGETGITRMNADMVIKAKEVPGWLGLAHDEAAHDNTTFAQGNVGPEQAASLLFSGDALSKYADLFSDFATFTPESSWHPSGLGLLLAAQANWQQGIIDPFDGEAGNPSLLLPVYTRLSDAEEHERERFAKPAEKDLHSGVQGANASCEAALSTGDATAVSLRYQPLDTAWLEQVAQFESQVMGSDAWNVAQLVDELPRADRSWWAAYEVKDPHKRMVSPEDTLVGYAGGWIVDGTLQILKVASHPDYRRQGIAQELLSHLALDARDLGATEATLEVRASNTGAHAFYERLGLKRIGVRPRYYSDREDAVIYTGPLPLPAAKNEHHDVAGMDLRINEEAEPLVAEKESFPQSKTLILAIETSCDETAAAIVDETGTIIADVVASQIDFHARFGGVVPEIASRKHIEAIGGVVQECLNQAASNLRIPSLVFTDLSAVSVTYAPGLVGALVVGLAFAKGLAWACNLPLIGVNHLEGHIFANKIEHPDITPPMVVSLVSGGHTMLVHVKDWGVYETMGSTLDDAVGEAFDKVAKAMGLGYPGGPIISQLAQSGNPKAIRFPRALLHSGDLQFSLSGLKTSVMTYLQKEQQAGREINQSDVAASFQAAVIDVQIAKAKAALEQTGAHEFCLGGGVAANPALRHAYEELCDQLGVRLTMPPLSACTDNAAMIALVALDRYQQQKFFDFDCDVSAHAPLDEPY